MKPFDLELALAGDPCESEEFGKVIQIFHADKLENERNVFCVFENGRFRTFTTTGSYYPEGYSILDSKYNLLMSPKKTKYYFGTYKNRYSGGRQIGMNLCISEDDARKKIELFPPSEIESFLIHEIEIEE